MVRLRSVAWAPRPPIDGQSSYSENDRQLAFARLSVYRGWIERKECHDGTLWRGDRCREGHLGRRVVDEPGGAMADDQRRRGVGGARRAPAAPCSRRSSSWKRRAATILARRARCPPPASRYAIVNPRQVRDFAKALGRLEKTDAIDAGVLAAFAVRIQPAPRPLPDDLHADLQALVTCLTAARRYADGRAQPGPTGPGAPCERICATILPGS